MALLSRAILLICIAGYVSAQYPSEDNIPQRIGATTKPRYQRLQNARPAGAQIQSIIGGARPRRPIALSRPRPIPTGDGPDFPSLTSARPRPVFAGPLSGKDLHVPTAAQERHQVKQEQQQQQQQQEQSVIKPVSEETEENEDVAKAIASLGAVANFPQQSGNLVAGPLTPKPDLGLIQYRGGSPAGSARPAPLNEQNIAPVQYRPQKPLKLRKTIVEDVPEIRVPVRQQQQQQKQKQQQQHQQQQHQQQQQQQQHQRQQQQQERQEQQQEQQQQQDQQQQQQQQQQQRQQSQYQRQPTQAPARTAQKTPEQREKYSGSREKKPVAQIIRRWREDNADGSITWGFENDDGSYKEELIGVDCITRGKYGYVDLDGLRREYSYETGIKCDEEQQEEDRENGFVDYTENKLVLPNGKTIDLSSMGKKQARRPQAIYRN